MNSLLFIYTLEERIYVIAFIKIELNKISKPKLFLAWLCTIFIVLGITAIIIMGLGTDNKLGEFTMVQDSNVIRLLVNGKAGQL